MWNTVEEFAQWYKAEGFPVRPPFEDPVYVTEISYSYVLFREGQYQAELYLVRPNTSSPAHSHPGVENIVMIWGGDVSLEHNGVYTDSSPFNTKTKNGTSSLFGVCGPKLTDKENHALFTGNKGGAFLSLEKWVDRKPTSVTVNWAGNTIGAEHDKTINEGSI